VAYAKITQPTTRDPTVLLTREQFVITVFKTVHLHAVNPTRVAIHHPVQATVEVEAMAAVAALAVAVVLEAVAVVVVNLYHLLTKTSLL
jgi:hypothetical protein